MYFKLPIAWLQLRYQKIRLIVALAGVVFAVVIIFMQLGLQDALFDSAVRLHQGLEGDCFLISPRSTALVSMQSFSQRRLLQVLAFPEVDFVTPIYLDMAQWKNPQTRNYWRSIYVIGFNLRYHIFSFPGVEENREKLTQPDVALYDRYSRTEFGPVVSLFEQNKQVTTELTAGQSNKRIKIVGFFELGSSFGSDGNLLTSDLNFFKIFPYRNPQAVDIGLIKLKPTRNPKQLINQVKTSLPTDIKILSKKEFIEFEINHWKSGTAIGFIFKLGVILGTIVGMVVVYQILYTNVSEHLSEYATLKAIGYRHRYLLFIVLQQSCFIAILGYIPGFLISVIVYEFTKGATRLPVSMTFDKALLVVISTVIMCFISGAIAVRKLQAADPADIF